MQSQINANLNVNVSHLMKISMNSGTCSKNKLIYEKSRGIYQNALVFSFSSSSLILHYLLKEGRLAFSKPPLMKCRDQQPVTGTTTSLPVYTPFPEHTDLKASVFVVPNLK